MTAPTGPSFDEALGGRPAGERGHRPIGAERSAGPVRHRAGHAWAEDLEPRTDWRLSAWLAGLLAGGLAVVLALVWTVRTIPGGEREVIAAHDGSRTMLAVLTDAKGTATAAALLGVTGDRATCVMTPRRLAVDVPGTGPTSLDRAVRSPDDASTAAAVSRTLDVRVDDTWKLSRTTLERLVDGAGGVRVDPDVAIGPHGIVEDDASRLLDGPRAGGWVTAAKTPARERDAVRMARFYAVLDGVFAGLPDSPARREAALRDVYDENRTTLPRERFVRLLGVLHERAVQEKMSDAVLPVDDRNRVDRVRFGALLEGPLARVRLPKVSGTPVRVMVSSPPGDVDLGARAQARLSAAQLRFVGDQAVTASGGNAVMSAPPEDADRTTIVVRSRSRDDQDRAERVREALGLPDAEIVVQKLAVAVADVLVRLGVDFQELVAKDE